MAARLLEAYRKEVERIFGADLVSLTLYGSHAADVPDPGREVSVLIVVGALRREALAEYRKIAPRYDRRGIPVPPIVTEAFLRQSADVFPLEFLGMTERRRVLAGRDVLEGLSVSTANLRHQVEMELKGKLLSLVRMYMQTFGGKEVAALMRDTAGPIVSVARGLLLLDGRTAPHDKEAIVGAVEERFGLPLPNIRLALAAHKGEAIPSARAEAVFFGYRDEVEALGALADGLARETSR